MTKPPLQLDSFLCVAIYSASHAFTRLYKALLQPLGLTYPQYLVMVALWENDDQSVGDLGKKLYLDSSTLTPLLKRLESMGLVARQRNPMDERQVRLRLTETGKALRTKAEDIPNCVLSASGLSLNDIQRLQREITGLQKTISSRVGNDF